jgi:hypothetical protein
MFTYIALDLETKRFYIGSSTNPTRRIKEHTRNQSNTPFYNALKHHDFFWFVSTDDGKETRDEEQFYLNFYFGTPWCLNCKPDAHGGRSTSHTEETRQKMRESHKNRPPISEETRRRLSVSKQGAVFTETHRANMSRARTGTTHHPWNRGRKWFTNIKTGETALSYSHPGEGWRPGRQ